MALLDTFKNLVQDPPPAYGFEISRSGIAWAHSGPSPELHFAPLENDVLAITPLKDNVARPEPLFQAVRQLTSQNGRRRTAALILPDYSTRVTVLDFDSFPSDKAEQEKLVRFRVKKSVPYDIDSARVSYFVQSSGDAGSRYEVVVAVAALEIVARYEAAFRAAGIQPGYVTTSALAALPLASGDGVRVSAKLNGGVLTVCVLDGPRLKLQRCVELPELSEQEVMGVLYPTLAYVEDRMQTSPSHLYLCGFGELGRAVADHAVSELSLTVEPLRSRLAPPDDTNAGLLGFLESIGGA